MRLYVLILLLVGCKPHHAAVVSAELKSGEAGEASREPARDLATGQPVADEAAAYRELEVADCPPELCDGDTELVEATPEGTDELVATTLGGKDVSSFALAGQGAASFDDVVGANASLLETFANGGIDGLRALSAVVTLGNALSQLEGRTPKEKIESARVILAALRQLDQSTGPELRRALLEGRDDLSRYKPLQSLLAGFGETATDEDVRRFMSSAESALTFFRDNLISSTDEGKLKILEAVLEAVPPELLEDGQGSSPHGLAKLGDQRTAALVAAAKRFAGRDGYVNHGDSVRILPVVPRLVAEVADQKIAEGYAQGIAQLAAQRPFVYRRWMKRPNGLIGRAVNRRIGQAMAQANAAKWNAVRQAGAATQKMYGDLMSDLGVRRYYLGLESDANHWDPDTELRSAEIRSLERTLTGLTVEQIATRLAASGGGTQGAQAQAARLKAMVGKLSFPDGIPVSEVVALLEAYAASGEVRIPHGMDFRMGQNGKVEVVRHKDRCECYYEPQVNACIMTFTPAGDATKRYFPSDVASTGSCDFQTQCHANFVKRGRTVNLMKACGQTFRDRATGQVFVYGNQ